VKVGDEIEIVGFKPTFKRVVTGVEMFRKLLDEGWRGQHRGAAARDGEGRSGARAGVGQGGVDHAAHEVQAEVYVLTKERAAAHAVFQWVSAAVLHSDDGRDRVAASARGGGDGDAGDNTQIRRS